jgi:hypothetical protein
MFFPWAIYTSVSREKKQTVYNKQRLWNFNFKSIIVEGFKENGDTALINDVEGINNSNSKKINLKTVTEYLRDLRHPISNNIMYDYVYPSISNKRELLSVENITDSENYAVNLKGKLERLMTTTEIMSMAKISKIMSAEKWRAFSRITSVEDTSLEPRNLKQNWVKRSRTSRDGDLDYQTTNTPVSKTIGKRMENVLYSEINSIGLTAASSVTTMVPPLENVSKKNMNRKIEETVMELASKLSNNYTSHSMQEQHYNGDNISHEMRE